MKESIEGPIDFGPAVDHGHGAWMMTRRGRLAFWPRRRIGRVFSRIVGMNGRHGRAPSIAGLRRRGHSKFGLDSTWSRLATTTRTRGVFGGLEHLLKGQQVGLDRHGQVAHSFENFHSSGIFRSMLKALSIYFKDLRMCVKKFFLLYLYLCALHYENGI